MTAPVSSAAVQNGLRSAASSTLPIPRGKVEIIAPGKPAASAALSTVAARAPSCSGTLASGTNRRAELGVVEQAAPGLPFRRRQLVTEPVRPASDHVTVDPLLVHPSETSSNVAQALHDRPRRLAAGKGDRQAGAVLDQAQRAEAPMLLADLGEKLGRHEMAVNVDDHSDSPTVFTRSRAAAIMSPSCASLIGRLFTTIPSGRTASLPALAIAA